MRDILFTATFCVVSFTTLFAQGSIVDTFVARSYTVRSGVFRSTNSGTSWSAVNNGLPANCSVLACAISGTYLFAGTDVSGVFHSNDNGTSWTAASTGLPTNTEVTAFAVSPNGASGANLFAATNGGGVYLSTDNGTSWTAASTGLTTPYIRALAISPAGGGSGTNLFAGTRGFSGGVFLSTDNGTSWTEASTGLTSHNVFALAVSGPNLFAGTFGVGVFLSTDNGASWNAASTGLANRYVNSLAVIPNGAGGTNLFAGTNGGGVYLSTNSGASWTVINNGLTNTNVFAFAVSGSNLFVGTDQGGVFRSSDSGASWTVASPGLTNTNVNALAVSPNGGGGTNLFAGTDKGLALPYRLFIPDNYSVAKKYPLVLALHGSGERGTDNTSQMKGRLATSWADPVNQAKYACFVVAPQCPTNEYWGDDPIVATSIDLMDSLIREFTIDTNRLYITGLSMGGYGTWDMITRFPNRFAAAIPMSGGGTPATVSTIANMPIWNFHGAQDPSVPVEWSRDMFEALKGIGRTVVYTQCHNNDCSGLSDSTIAMYVKSHADLFYSEYQFDGHGPWDKYYDYHLLFPWVFDKYRLTPGAITITHPRYHRALKGIETVNWQSLVGGDSVEIWNSPDAGGTWQMVSRSAPNNGSYQWDTHNFKDGAFELLKVFLKNQEGFIFGHDQSSYFAIDNAIDGTPFVKILNEEFTTGETFNQDTLTLRLLVGDSKTIPLTVRLSYSPDGGQHFNQFDSYTTMGDTTSSARIIHLARFENSNNEVIKVEVDDGMSVSSDQTYPFSKQTPTSVAGRSGGELPKSFALGQNFPNPFNPTTKIQYAIPVDAKVALEVYDMLGRRVAEMVKGDIAAGYHDVTFDASNFASGMYICRIQSIASDGKNFVQVRKLMLLK